MRSRQTTRTTPCRRLRLGRRHCRGFSLLELALFLTVAALIGAAAVPIFLQQQRLRSAEKLTQQVSAVVDAARNYYVAAGAWPATSAALVTAGYLQAPVAGEGIGPTDFGTLISGAPAGATFAVSVAVPQDVAPAVSSRLAFGAVGPPAAGLRTVSVAAPLPGSVPDLAGILDGSIPVGRARKADNAETASGFNASYAGTSSMPFQVQSQFWGLIDGHIAVCYPQVSGGTATYDTYTMSVAPLGNQAILNVLRSPGGVGLPPTWAGPLPPRYYIGQGC